MNTNAPAPDQVYGYEVMDTNNDKIGTVDGVWVDDASNQLEFVGVKTGWLMGKTHLIPVQDASFAAGAITVPYSKDQIKDAPSFGTDDELSPDDESQIYSYYGMDRSTSPSPTGYGEDQGTASADYGTAGTDVAAAGTGTTAYDTTDTGDRNLVLSEEELQVGKRPVEAGRVRLRKVVNTEQVNQPVELQREEVQIERVDAADTDVPGDAFQEDTLEVPVMREEPVVAKEAHATGRVHLDKNVQTETQNVGGEVRREDVEVDDASGLAGTTGRRTIDTTDGTDQGV